MDQISQELNLLRSENRFRSTQGYARSGMMLRDENGMEFLDFSSNDYLGLASHPELKLAAIATLNEYGTGSTSSRLLSGTSPEHVALEEVLAEKKQTEAALFFSTGYMTAQSVIPSLMGKEDVILIDKLAHACLIDAARGSGARIRVFPHNHIEKLESLLQTEGRRLKAGRRLLVLVESVYSMDGDLCPLREIVALKEKYGALLLVDEAHGLGIMGDYGMGLVDTYNLEKRVDLQMGTLGKAAGGAGGYIACSKEVRDLIVNKGRSFIYTTAPPPAQAAIAKKALEIIDSPEGRSRRITLGKHRLLLGNALKNTPLPSAICPLIIGENTQALQASAQLREKGFLAPAIRYPTVARGTARLRLTLTASHTEEQVRKLLNAIQELSHLNTGTISRKKLG